MKKKLATIATSYSDEQVLLATVDASKNSELKKYLFGAYPTIRVFSKGKVGGKSFTGNKSESFVRSFIDEVVSGEKEMSRQASVRKGLIELQTAREFEELIASSQVPVMVKFSASW